MKRLLVLLLLIAAAFTGLDAIECILADGRAIPADSRQYHFRHHNSNVDFHFFGSNKWVVRFDIQSAYPTLSSVSFNVQGVRLFFPNPGDSVTVELYTDQDGQPGSPVRTASAPIDQSLMDISFSEVYNAETVWLMVSYPTSVGNRWVSASRGGGEHSYFLNAVGEMQVLSSFAAAGFGAELLFGLLGEFVLPEQDLQLCSFDLQGDLLPGNSVIPAFSVYNHGDHGISSANLLITLSRPGAPAYATHNIVIPDEITPRTLMQFDGETSWLQSISLPDSATQMSVVARLTGEHPENDTLLVNNTITKAFSVFTDEIPILLTENLLHQDESAVINAIQDAYPDSRMHRLNYFPMLSDSLANLASQRRFFWYGLNSLPVTIGMGKGRITGFREDYGSLYADLTESMAGSRTFISSSSCSAGSQEGTESVNVNLELHNARTRIYTSGAQSIMSGSRIFVALARKFTSDGVDRYYLDRFVAFADTTSATLGMGASLTKTYSFTISGITSGELVANYRLYYWIQGNDGSAIHYVNYMDFEPDHFVTNQDIVNQVPALRVGPNPAVKGQSISVTAKSGGRISIYNIRGQLILRENEFKGTLDLPNSLFPVSGVYLLRFEGKGNTPETRKISIIK